MRTNRVALAAACVAGALVAAPLLAETAQMTGRFPAPYREASMLISLSIDRLGGRDGSQTGYAIERALGSGNHFDLVGGRRGGRADGTLSGVVSSGVEDSGYRRKDKKCVERKPDNSCAREEEVEIACTRRIANLTADLRIVRNTDGRVVYSVNKPLRRELTWCTGESPGQTMEEMITAMVAEIANSVRSDITPYTDTYRIRFIEGTRGIPREQVRRFKDTVRLSQRNLPAACADWTQMNALVPNHSSIVFNLGLCAEAAGDLQAAVRWYRDASPLLGGRNNDADKGIARMQNRMAQDAMDAERARRS